MGAAHALPPPNYSSGMGADPSFGSTGQESGLHSRGRISGGSKDTDSDSGPTLGVTTLTCGISFTTTWIHEAGLRNGVFDSTFFGSQHLLGSAGVSAAMSYAAAAAAAVCVHCPHKE